jgi:hypothetical protein
MVLLKLSRWGPDVIEFVNSAVIATGCAKGS